MCGQAGHCTENVALLPCKWRCVQPSAVQQTPWACQAQLLPILQLHPQVQQMHCGRTSMWRSRLFSAITPSSHSQNGMDCMDAADHIPGASCIGMSGCTNASVHMHKAGCTHTLAAHRHCRATAHLAVIVSLHLDERAKYVLVGVGIIIPAATEVKAQRLALAQQLHDVCVMCNVAGYSWPQDVSDSSSCSSRTYCPMRVSRTWQRCIRTRPGLTPGCMSHLRVTGSGSSSALGCASVSSVAAGLVFQASSRRATWPMVMCLARNISCKSNLLEHQMNPLPSMTCSISGGHGVEHAILALPACPAWLQGRSFRPRPGAPPGQW